MTFSYENQPAGATYTEAGFLTPGCLVRHPDRPDWGIGQIQSAIGDRITVNFENQGKILINALRIILEPVTLEEASQSYFP